MFHVSHGASPVLEKRRVMSHTALKLPSEVSKSWSANAVAAQ